MAVLNAMGQPYKPDMRELGIVKSGVNYMWDDNPDEMVSKKGESYLRKVARDSHVKSCMRTRSLKVLKKEWLIMPKDTSDEAIYWADFAQWNFDEMQGSFNQDMAGMLTAVGYGYSVSEINYRYIPDGKYKGMVGLKSIRLKPFENVKFKTDKFGHVEKIRILTDYGSLSNEIDPSKCIHIVYGDDDENPYGDPSLSRIAFWVWLKKNIAQFWAIFAEKFGMPTVVAEVPNNATPAQENMIDDFLLKFQSESGLKIPAGFKASFLEAARQGNVGYDAFIERCNKEIRMELLGQTLSNDEGTRGQGSYAQASVHASTLDDYVTSDANMVKVGITEQIIWSLVKYNSATSLLPYFFWVDEIDGLTLLQNFDAIASRLPIPESWLYRKMGIPMPRTGETVIKVTEPVTPAQNGLDNRTKQVFSESVFSEDSDRREMLEKRDQELKQYDAVALNRMAADIDNVFTKVTDQFKKKLTAGEPIEKPPRYSVNMSELKADMINSAIVYWCMGKYYAQELCRGFIDGLPKPKVIKFAESELDFASPEDAVKYFSGLVNITKDEFEQVLVMYEERYFTVAGLVKKDIEKIYDNIVVGLQEGWNWPDFEEAVNEQKIQYTGVVFGDDLTGEPIKANHLKTIFQNNMMQAMADGESQFYAIPEVDAALWGFEYAAVGDDRTRDEHDKLNGTVRAKNDAFWKKYTPPWDHGCRCGKIPIMRSQIASGEYKITTKLPAIDPEAGFATRRTL